MLNCKLHADVVFSSAKILILLLLFCDFFFYFFPSFLCLVCTGSDREMLMDLMLCVYSMKDKSCIIALTGTGLASSLSQMARSLTPCGRLKHNFCHISGNFHVCT